MNIIGIQILGDVLSITMSEQIYDVDAIPTIYIDIVENEENKYSEKSEDHTYKVEEFAVADNTISFPLSWLEPELDRSAFIVNVNGEVAFYYDKKELYYRQVELMTTYCSTCLDKQQKDRMVLFVMKQQLLDYAVANNLLDDQIDYYKDLARMLSIDLKMNVNNKPFKTCVSCNGGKSRYCNNGVCTLC